jgi:cystathionine beta-lyase
MPCIAPAQFDFDTIPDRRRTGSLKWDKYKDPNVLPLWVADMDFAAPPVVLQALAERLEHGVLGYTLPTDSNNQAVVEYLSKRHQLSVGPESIVWLPGLVPALNLIARAFARRGEAVLTATPVYPPFLTAPTQHGRISQAVPLTRQNGQWTFDWPALERTVTTETRIFFLCHPHNPVGRVFNRAELEKLVDFCRRHELLLVSDEIHCDLILDPEISFTPTLTLAERGDQMIGLYAPSKTWNLPGLSCAFAIVPDPAVRRVFKAEMAGIVTEINTFGLTGCEAALRHGEPWRLALLDYLRENRDLVYEALSPLAPEVKLYPMEATYLAWLDVREWNVPNPAAACEAAGVGLSDGAFFGQKGFLRLNFGCPRSILREGLDRLKKAVISS